MLALSAAALPAVQAQTPASPINRAPVDRSQKPEGEAVPKISFPDYTETVLSNGLKVFIVQSDRQPRTTLRLVVGSGSLYDGLKPGLASLVASQLTRGTGQRTAKSFAEESDFIGAEVSAGAVEDGLFLSASGLSEYLPTVLGLMTDALFNPVFPAEELAKEKRKAASRLDAEKQKQSSLAGRLSKRLLFGAHPYGALADEQSLAAIDTLDLKTFHRTYFVPNNATLAVVTDLAVSELLPQLEAAFRNWKAGAASLGTTLNLAAFPKVKGVNVHLINRPGSQQATILFGYRTVTRNHPDMLPFGLAASTLGSADAGRLAYNLREAHGWAYGAVATGLFYKLSGVFYATADVRTDAAADAIREMLFEMNRLKREPIGQRELQIQRDYLTGTYLLSLEDAGRTAARVQDMEMYALPKNYFKTYAATISAVDAKQSQALAKKYFNTSDVVIVVVGEATAIEESLKSIGKLTVYDVDLNVIR
ncbi:MAG: insulinase family protein [Rhizobacter sp.]|nr:insulinase family protein [Chlorobiales bacterium]